MNTTVVITAEHSRNEYLSERARVLNKNKK